MSTLVIVDMQKMFLYNANYKYVIEGCVKQVLLAKKRLANIILVEYSSKPGDTIPEIMKAIGTYKKVGTVLKSAPDGGSALVNYIKNNNINTKSIRFTGVYTNACVYETAKTTKSKLAGTIFSIVKDATGAGNSTPDDNFSLKYFSSELGFKII